jgi:hypothetical protein
MTGKNESEGERQSIYKSTKLFQVKFDPPLSPA